MNIYITYWDFRKKIERKLYCDSVEESTNVQSVLKRNGWKNIHGVWHSPKENG